MYFKLYLMLLRVLYSYIHSVSSEFSYAKVFILNERMPIYWTENTFINIINMTGGSDKDTLLSVNRFNRLLLAMIFLI